MITCCLSLLYGLSLFLGLLPSSGQYAIFCMVYGCFHMVCGCFYMVYVFFYMVCGRLRVNMPSDKRVFF